jgi:phage tail-like protein
VTDTGEQTHAVTGLEHAFVVRIGSSQALLGAFMEVSGIGAQFETFDYAEGGNPNLVKLRGRQQQSNLTLKSGLMDEDTLMQWTLGGGSAPRPQNIYITFVGSSGATIRSFGFAAAIPVRWTGPGGNIGASAVATESLELAHQGFILDA